MGQRDYEHPSWLKTSSKKGTPPNTPWRISDWTSGTEPLISRRALLFPQFPRPRIPHNPSMEYPLETTRSQYRTIREARGERIRLSVVVTLSCLLGENDACLHGRRRSISINQSILSDDLVWNTSRTYVSHLTTFIH